MQHSIYLSDILRRNNLDSNRIKLVRHSLNDKCFKRCFEDGFLEEYQKIQKNSVFKDCDYILSFISETGTSAKFYGCYSVGESMRIDRPQIPKGFPVPEMFCKGSFLYDLNFTEHLEDLQDRLIIEWGYGTRTWHQWANANDKPVLTIQSNPKYTFNGYENVALKYEELEAIINDKILYENWHIALSSVYAIYLVVDLKSGKQYIGSAYGSGGLISRWKCYVETGHGGNKGVIEAFSKNQCRKENFQFSILQILPKTITQKDVVDIEKLYKRKLCTKEFGLNKN